MASIYNEGHQIFAQYGLQYGIRVHLSTDNSYSFDCQDGAGDLETGECTANNYSAANATPTISTCGCAVTIRITGDADDEIIWTTLGATDDPQETVTFAWVEISDDQSNWYAWLWIDFTNTSLTGCDFLLALPDPLLCLYTGAPSASSCCDE